MGHVYRMLAFAAEMARHEVTIYLSRDLPLGASFFGSYPYRVILVADRLEFVTFITRSAPDLIVLDVLDTYDQDIRELRAAAGNCRIITFEDCGSGALEADVLVAEFVENREVSESRMLSGIEFSLLSPSFEMGQPPVEDFRSVDEILVLFGGSDPSRLAQRALASLKRVGFSGRVTAIRGLGAPPIQPPASLPFALEVLEDVKNMPFVMARAQFAFTSAGRTIIELISCGVPSVCMAQNSKELTHTHATEENGVLMLGLGIEVSDAAIDEATWNMIFDRQFRESYTKNARAAGGRRSNRRTISAILRKVGFEDFPDL